MNKNSNVLIAFLSGLSAGTALGLLLISNQRPKQQSAALLPRPSNKAAEGSGNLRQNRFKSENDDDFEDHVEHI